MYEIVIVITIVCNKRSVKIKNNRLGVEEKDCEKDKDLWVVVTAGLGRSGASVPPLFPAYLTCPLCFLSLFTVVII